MKTLEIFTLAIVVAGCATQYVVPQSPEYPAITAAEKQRILWNLPYYGADSLRTIDHLSDVVVRAQLGQPLTEREVAGMRPIVARIHADESKEKAEAQEAATTAASAAAQQEARRLARERDERAKSERMAEMRASQFKQSFDGISDPSSARVFQEIYANQPDPDGLLRKAEARGYEQGVITARRCISRANAAIAQQNQIAREVGYVDKAVMYQAGAALVRCKQNLAEWSKKVKR